MDTRVQEQLFADPPIFLNLTMGNVCFVDTAGVTFVDQYFSMFKLNNFLQGGKVTV